MVFFFFFFQAEDGIRDHCVTGVQTCALPISRRPRASKKTRKPSPTATRSTSGLPLQPDSRSNSPSIGRPGGVPFLCPLLGNHPPVAAMRDTLLATLTPDCVAVALGRKRPKE